MTLDVETEHIGTGQIGTRFVSYLRLMNGSPMNGFYTAMWADNGLQVYEHNGDMLTMEGYHPGGKIRLQLYKPSPPRTGAES